MNITTTNNKQITTAREFTIFAKRPMPDTALWHQTTNWKCAKELYEHYPHIWKKLKNERAIPLSVLIDIEDENIQKR